MMIVIVIAILIGGIAFAMYAFLSSSSEVKEKKQNEGSIYELKRQVISQNVKMQKEEFERSGLLTELEKLRKDMETAKSDLEEAKTNEAAMKDELQKMRLGDDDGSKTSLEMLKAENETLKERLMRKENDNKRLNDEVKLLTEKLKNAPVAAYRKEPEKTEKSPSTNLINEITKDVKPDIQVKKDDEKLPDIKPDLGK